MSGCIRLMSLATACMLWPGWANGQILFSETFNDGAGAARWNVLRDGDDESPDFDAQFGFNYASLGIAPAPRGTGTIGAKLDTNVTGAAGAEAINIVPVGQAFGGDFVVRFDVWARVGGDPANSAEEFLGGVNASGTRTNWFSIGGAGTDGVFYGAIGNGGNSSGFDYSRYVGNVLGGPQVAPLYDNMAAIPQATFPLTDGTPRDQWVTVDIEQINGVIQLRLNGVMFDSFTNNTPFQMGNIFLGHQDVVWTAAGNPQTFSIFDNVTAARVSRWVVDANASWNVFANWSFPTVGSPGVIAYFGDVLTAPRTVTMPSPQLVGDLLFDSSIAYTIGGNGWLTLQAFGGPSNLEVRRGNHVINVPVEFASSTRIDVTQPSSVLSLLKNPVLPPGIALTKTGAGWLQMTRVRSASLAVNGGTFQLITRPLSNDPATTSVVQTLSIAGTPDTPTATLDLTNNALIIDYSTVAPLTSVRQWLRAGVLTGKGLITSSPASTHRIGYLDNVGSTFSTFAGQPVDPSSLLVSYTFAGDANLDGLVDTRDLVRLASHWLGMGFWMDGDFNYDGWVNASDLTLMAINWQAGVLSPALVAELFPGQSIPEPASPMLALMAAMAICTNRRRRLRPTPPA